MGIVSTSTPSTCLGSLGVIEFAAKAAMRQPLTAPGYPLTTSGNPVLHGPSGPLQSVAKAALGSQTPCRHPRATPPTLT